MLGPRCVRLTARSGGLDRCSGSRRWSCPAVAPRALSRSARNDIVAVAKRSLTDITINEIMVGDVREFLRINSLVQQAATAGLTLRSPDGEPYRYVPITVVRPATSLGDTLDFSRPAIEARLAAGEAAARALG